MSLQAGRAVVCKEIATVCVLQTQSVWSLLARSPKADGMTQRLSVGQELSFTRDVFTISSLTEHELSSWVT